jgi:catechol 2,3-dioxygenase-like lactoylglutathione lyase family enzyme
LDFELKALDHVQLAMPPNREGDAEHFYSGLLGLDRLPKPPALAVRGGCWFRRGAVQIHLGVESDFRPARKAHPAIVVSGLDALCEKLRASGVSVRWSDEIPGVRRCHVDDPFGNRIELIEG